ncbi:MAG: alkaline phosphatase D family protein [Oceanicoccus sp.]
MGVSRRKFVSGALGVSVVAPVLGGCSTGSIKSASISDFPHGVASGDPLQDRVIIWTRVTTDAPVAEVSWQVSTDERFDQLIASGTVLTDTGRDYTVKVDVTGLQSGSNYYYRFLCDNHISTVGRTLTLPDGKPEKFSLATVSCSNFPAGYFNAYHHLANRDDVDVVLHLGDYIYEYANAEYGDGAALGRVPQPNKECTVIDDYRQRYACYREDQDLQAVHARHPFILVWDDHEFANNTWIKGAENHSESEGAWADRRADATKAYFEWMPVRDSVSDRQQRIYRSFHAGDLFDLIMLDTRVIGRDEQIDKEHQEELGNAERSLLGTQQEHWLTGELSASKQYQTLWRVFGQQVVVAPVIGADGKALNTDAWDGYPAARQRFLSQLKDQGTTNNVVLTGDVHSSWANDVAENPFDPNSYNPETGEGALAVEFVTPAVSSPSPISPQEKAEQSARDLVASHPHIKYVDLFWRGYMVLDINRSSVTNSWYHLDTVLSRPGREHLASQYRVTLNKPGLSKVD